MSKENVDVVFRAKVVLPADKRATWKIGDIGLPTVEIHGEQRATMRCRCEGGPLGAGDDGICEFAIVWGKEEPFFEPGEPFRLMNGPTYLGDGVVVEIIEILE